MGRLLFDVVGENARGGEEHGKVVGEELDPAGVLVRVGNGHRDFKISEGHAVGGLKERALLEGASEGAKEEI